MKFTSLFRALSGSTLLEKAYSETERVHRATLQMFLNSVDSITGGSMSCEVSVIQKDKEINREIVDIRRELFNYVSISSNPNIAAVLSLTSIVIDYERIGDYSKNIAQLPTVVKGRLTNEYYSERILRMNRMLKQIFDLTGRAFIKENEEEAKEAVRIHEKVKKLHLDLLQKMDVDENLSRQEAIFYALLSNFFRRINAHLSNICTAIYQPFPKIGFA